MVDFTFVPIKLHIIRTIQSSNIFRSVWTLIQSFYVLSLPLNIMSSVDFFSCVPSIFSSEYLNGRYYIHIKIFIKLYG